jgi:hypothetical protein
MPLLVNNQLWPWVDQLVPHQRLDFFVVQPMEVSPGLVHCPVQLDSAVANVSTTWQSLQLLTTRLFTLAVRHEVDQVSA